MSLIGSQYRGSNSYVAQTKVCYDSYGNDDEKNDLRTAATGWIWDELMALIDVGMPCSLCGQPIKVGDTYVATTHFISDRSDPLWRYSDSAMHKNCFEGWSLRTIFTKRYRQVMRGKPGIGVMEAPKPRPPPPLPEFLCPQCGTGLRRAQRSECPKCGWMQYPSDRSRWSKFGACTRCGFSYRWDGRCCSHCGLISEQ
jgi:hypothetical protein